MSKNSESSVNQVPHLEKGLKNTEAGDMARWLRASTALSEDPGSVPSAHIDQFTTACNSSSTDSGWHCLLASTATWTNHMATLSHKPTHIHINKNNLLKLDIKEKDKK